MPPRTRAGGRPDYVALARQSVLVAGAGGFIGANLVRELAGRGAAVHALVRPGSRVPRLDGLAGRVTLHRVDTADPAALRECLRTARPAAVVNLMRTRGHLAAGDPMAAVRDNVVAAANLVAAVGHSGCTARFVQFGSSTEYEARPGPLDESTPIQPATLQGATKAAATLLCRELAAEIGVPLVVLRPFQVYGPWDEPGQLVPAAIAAGLDGRELELAPHGERDWVFVADVVEACLLALHEDLDGEDLNLGGGRQWSNEEVVAAIADISGQEVRIRIDEQAARPWDRNDWVANISKARALLGWVPRHDLRAGLEKTIAWERERRARLGGHPAVESSKRRAAA